MFKSIINDYSKSHKKIIHNQLKQQQRLKEFDVKHRATLNSMSKRQNEFEELKDKVNKELIRHF